MNTLCLENYGVSQMETRELKTTDGGVLPWYVYVAIASMIYDAIKGFSAGAKDAAREASK